MAAVVRFTHESASAKLIVWDMNHATISNLYSTKPRRGHATELMKMIVSHAELSGLDLLLEARQYGNPHGMTNAQLKQFYAKFGFVECGDSLMLRSLSRELHAS